MQRCKPPSPYQKIKKLKHIKSTRGRGVVVDRHRVQRDTPPVYNFRYYTPHSIVVVCILASRSEGKVKCQFITKCTVSACFTPLLVHVEIIIYIYYRFSLHGINYYNNIIRYYYIIQYLPHQNNTRHWFGVTENRSTDNILNNIIFLCLVNCYNISRSALDSEFDDLETPPRYRPESVQYFCRTTGFTESEIKKIYRNFKTECPTGLIKEDAFRGIYSQFFPQGGIMTFSENKSIQILHVCNMFYFVFVVLSQPT